MKPVPFEYDLRVRAFPLGLCIDEGTGPYGREKQSRASKQHPHAMIPTEVTGRASSPSSAGHPSTLSWKEDGQSKQSMAKGRHL